MKTEEEKETGGIGKAERESNRGARRDCGTKSGENRKAGKKPAEDRPVKLQRFKGDGKRKGAGSFPNRPAPGSRRCDIDQMGDPADRCLFSGAVGGDRQHLSDGCVYRISMSGLRF